AAAAVAAPAAAAAAAATPAAASAAPALLLLLSAQAELLFPFPVCLPMSPTCDEIFACQTRPFRFAVHNP
ncbi:unnamed protein product, partial [Lampetra planeri]